jgi:hypothetical protein
MWIECLRRRQLGWGSNVDGGGCTLIHEVIMTEQEMEPEQEEPIQCMLVVIYSVVQSTNA